MAVYENLKSTVLIPTKKCCALMCANFSKPSETSADAPPGEKPKAKVVIQQENVDHPHHLQRRPTGWTPAHRMTVAEVEARERDELDDEEEEEDDDDDKPKTAKKSSDKTVLYLTSQNANPLKMSATTAKPDKDSEVNKFSTMWSRKDPLVYSAVTVPNNKSSRYWVKSDLQYLFLIPTRQKRQPTIEELFNIPSQDERTSTKSIPSKQQTGSSQQLSNPPSWDDKITRRSTAFFEESLRRTLNEEKEEEEDIYQLKSAKNSSPAFDYGDDDDDSDEVPKPVKKKAKKKRGFLCFKRNYSSSS